MSAIIIIPARYASTRFPGKPLIEFKGSDGTLRPLIEHTWRAGKAVPDVEAVYVATDDERITNACKAFGASVVLTSPDCKNGTERCAEALTKIPENPDIVVNLQGDAPLTPTWFLSDLILSLRQNKNFEVATPVLKCDEATLKRLRTDRQKGRVGGTTAVFDKENKALYFSKEVLPFGSEVCFHHVGVYGYRPGALAACSSWQEGNLERSEGLEQLRFLENSSTMLCVEVDAKGREFWEVNNPEDIVIIEEMLRVSDA
jgi:3-deoxy-manno-octulosonate cytidylyltransferase (CMP-KDO synthetase)